MPGQGCDQRLLDGLARVVGHVQNARYGVSALANQRKVAIALAIELHSGGLDQYLFHQVRPLAGQDGHGSGIAVTVAGPQDVSLQGLG
jgi:hypothetical protein